MSEYVLLAIALGINDSLNPYGLSIVLLFLIFLSFYGCAPGHVIISGLFLTLSLSLMIFLSIVRGYDIWLESAVMNTAVRILSLGMAAVLGGFGFISFSEWWRGKKDSRAGGAGVNRLPVFLGAYPAHNAVPCSRRGVLREFVSLIIVSVLLGTLGTVLGSLWPKSQHLYLSYYSLMTAGRPQAVILFLGFYSLASAFCVVVVWLVVLSISYSERIKGILIKAVSFVRITSSAVLLSMGLGLLYLFFYR
ncbi:MAG: hypothetical protein A3G91_03965 [Omnitrophica WOR_2 bacterium RIFCSPLOWO2_12_FULL_50_9]|nr:MAG: hypothetical protein A3D87_06475 [Omnitrophica WOR_2 bacterium RIFCSPHIGHO2_02_FULL_50_17]OGX43510.1 MAG: hypothetical protein A3G91_03965 [Omnitrophica WOR_2 bacterium RIFCSPLOWO2_12_FULL_50_9]